MIIDLFGNAQTSQHMAPDDVSISSITSCALS